MIKTIRSRDNAFVRRLIALAQQSRARKKESRSVLDGAHLVEAFLQSHTTVEAIAISESAIESDDAKRVLLLLERKRLADRVAVNVLEDSLLASASNLESPSSIMAIIETPQAMPIPADATAVLILDNVQDPGNVGSMLRSAAAAGVSHVMTSAGTAFVWSPKVLRAGQGAHFSLNIVESADVMAFLTSYRGQSLALIPASENAIPLYDRKRIMLTKPTALIVGNEGAGLSKELIAAATHRVTIPMPGKMESLNAAACAAIVMFEMVRQRLT
jgi:RNA methyltransferase, TrmH family